MPSSSISAYAVVKPCISPGAHRFTAHYPPPGNFGPVIILCSRCGMTAAEARS